MNRLEINCTEGEFQEIPLTQEEILDIEERAVIAQQEANKPKNPTAEERIQALEEALLVLMG